jgi:Tfp pilus assembly protein PilN
VKAVNLIPSDARRGRTGSSPRLGAAHGVVALLAVAVALVTLYVLTSNTVAHRTATLATLKTEVAQANVEAQGLAAYTRFEKLAQTRAATIRKIAATRFDWHAALADLSKVVPPDTSLQSLTATVSPGSGGSGASTAAAGGSLRSALPDPAFEMVGCTRSQDDVARLMSRLRAMNGVTRVTLEGSQTANGASGTPAAGTSATAGAGGSSCSANGPTFDLVVFFNPIPTLPTGPAS